MDFSILYLNIILIKNSFKIKNNLTFIDKHITIVQGQFLKNNEYKRWLGNQALLT